MSTYRAFRYPDVRANTGVWSNACTFAGISTWPPADAAFGPHFRSSSPNQRSARWALRRPRPAREPLRGQTAASAVWSLPVPGYMPHLLATTFGSVRTSTPSTDGSVTGRVEPSFFGRPHTCTATKLGAPYLDSSDSGHSRTQTAPTHLYRRDKGFTPHPYIIRSSCY